MPGRRNRVAMNPLLRKGGAHERSRSTDRRDARQHLDELIDDWYTPDDEKVDLKTGNGDTNSGRNDYD